MEEHPEYTAAKWAKMLKVSLSGYNAYRARKEQRDIAEQDYKDNIRELFEQSRGTYGVDRALRN